MGVSQGEPGTGYELHQELDVIPDLNGGRATQILYLSKSIQLQVKVLDLKS